jgi:hypothetical protein
LKTDLLISETAGERDELKRQLEEAADRFDQLKTASSKKDSAITAKDMEISGKKEKIRELLDRVNAGKKELDQARRLINSLNTDLDQYKKQIEQLEGRNLQLTMENQTVTGERDQYQRQFDSARAIISEKEDLIDVGSTLHASRFYIMTLREKSGGREVSTGKAKKADKMRIRFDLDENMIASSGTKDLFIIITDPQGKPLINKDNGSGSFTARDGGELVYTRRVEINYIQNQRQTVEFDWKHSDAFQPGKYRLEVFHNGFKIGEAICPLS